MDFFMGYLEKEANGLSTFKDKGREYKTIS